MTTYSKLTKAELIQTIRELEDQLRARSAGSLPEFSTPNQEQLLHDPKVHQVELQAQNEELRGMQELLEESRDRYTDFYDFACGYLTLDASGIIREINLTGASLLGGERSHLMGMPLSRCLVPDGIPMLSEHLRQCLGQAREATAELYLRVAERPPMVVQVVSVAVQGAKTGAVLIRMTMMDVTERKRTEEALRASENKYRQLFKEMSNGCAVHELVCDDAGRPIDYITLEVNAAYEKLLGVQGEMVVGKRAYEAVPDLDREWLDLFGSVTLTGQPRHYTQYASNVDKWFEGTAFRMMEGHFCVTFVDITERKRAEDLLQSTTETLRTLVKSAPVSIVTRDLNDKITSVNPAGERIFGWTEQELIGQINPAVLPDEIDTFRATERIVREGNTITNEHVLRHRKDGSPVHVIRSEAPVRDSEGQVHGIVTIAIDITEQKRAEEALRESELRFRTLARVSPIGIYLTDVNGRCLYVNERWCEMAGLTLQEALGDGWVAGLYPQDRERIAAVWYDIAKSKGKWNIEYRFQTRKGEITWVIGNAVEMFNAHGEIIGYIGTNTDITERKRAEEALRESEQRYRRLFEQNQAGVYYTSMDGRIVDCNETFAHILGYASREEIQTRPAADLYFDESERSAFVAQLKERGALTNFELRLQRKDGTPVWILENASTAPDASGQPMFIQGTLIDITERKRAEEELQKLGALIDSSPDFVSVTSLDGRLQYLNRGGRALVGLNEADVSSLQVSQFAVPERAPRIENVMTTVMREGRWKGEGTLRHFQTNRVIPTEMQVFLIPHPQTHEPMAIGTVMQDITERKQAEELLRKSESLLKDAQRISKMGGWDYDVQTRAATFTDSIFDIYGVTFVEAEDGVKFYHPDDRELVWQAFTKAITENEPYDLEVRFINAQGENLWVRTMGKPEAMNGKVIKVVGNLMDITERKRAEEALRQSEDKFRYVFDYSVIGNSLTLLSGKIQVNKAMCEMLGYSPEELQNKRWQDITLPDDIELTQREVDTLLSGKKEYVRFTKRFLHKNGSVVWVDLSSSLRRDKDGNPLYLMSSLSDITERKLAEEALRQSEQRYRLISENAADVIWVLDPMAGKFTYVSPSVEKLRGYTPAEVMAQPFAESLTPESLAMVGELLATRLPAFVARGTGTEFFTNQVDQPRKDGSIVQTEVSTTVMFDERGQVEIVGVSRDITERKRAEKALRESEERFRSLIEQSSEGVALVDEQNQVVEWNPALGKITGIPRSEAIGASFWALQHRLLPSELRAQLGPEYFKDRMAPFFVSGQVPGLLGSIEFEIQTDTGERKSLHMSSFPIRTETGYRNGAVVRDTTERKRAEEQVRAQAARLKLLADASKAFAAVGQDYHAMLDQVARQVTEVLADMCQIRLLSDDGKLLELAALYSLDPELSESLRVLKPPAVDLATDPGLAVQVFRTGKAALVPSLTLEQLWASNPPEYRALFERFKVHSFILVALRIQGRSIGGLGLTRYRSEQPAFTEDDVRLAQDLADRAALAINSARLFERAQNELTERKRAEERIRREAERAQALVRTATRLNAQLDLDGVLHAVCEETTAALHAPVATIRLYDEQRQELNWVASTGLPPDAVPEVRSDPLGVFDSYPLQQDSIWIIPDLQAAAGLPNADRHAKYDLRTNVTAKMQREDKLVGTLSIGTIGLVREFTAEELELLQGLAAQAAQAVTNAQLFRSVSEQRVLLRELRGQLVSTEEIERRHLSQELHDRVGQTIAAISINLTLLKNQLPADATAKVGPRFDDLSRLVAEIAKHTREVMDELRPPGLDDFGLTAALHWYADQVSTRSGIAIMVEGQDVSPRLPRANEMALFRIAQEALTNVVKHSHASEVLLQVEETPDQVHFSIADNGTGFDYAALPLGKEGKRWGIVSMRERAQAIGGNIEIKTAPGQGTCVTVNLPR